MPDLSKRENMVLIGGILFVVLFCGFQFGIVPVLEKKDDLKRILGEKNNNLEEMMLLRQQFIAGSKYTGSKARILAARPTGFSLFSFLDSQAEQSGVKGNVAYMKPLTKRLDNDLYTLASVKVKLSQVVLKDLVAFLYRIESSENSVDIISLSLSKAGRDKLKIDAVLEAQTLMVKEKA